MLLGPSNFARETGVGPIRFHVKPLLLLLTSIVQGMPEDNHENAQVLDSLLLEVLIPLHAPEEMFEWRSQIPVIQV